MVVLAIGAIVLSVAGCGDSAERSVEGQADPRAAAREFLDSVAAKDPEGFCRLTMDDIREDNFETANVPASGSCEERAAAMFAARRPGGTTPLWELLAQAKLGAIDLRCKPGTEQCSTATILIEGVPLGGGGTTDAPLPLTHTASGWRVGSR